MTSLQRTIEQLDNIKHRLMESANEAKSNETRKRELRAAIDIHKVTKKLDRIHAALVPFAVEAITTEPAPNQMDLLAKAKDVLWSGVTA